MVCNRAIEQGWYLPFFGNWSADLKRRYPGAPLHVQRSVAPACRAIPESARLSRWLQHLEHSWQPHTRAAEPWVQPPGSFHLAKQKTKNWSGGRKYLSGCGV